MICIALYTKYRKVFFLMIIMQIREVLSPKEEKSKVSTKTMFPNIDLKVAHSKRQTADFANKKKSSTSFSLSDWG